MIKSPFGFRILALVLAAFCFAVSASAGTVTFFTDFTAGSKPASSYRENNAKSSLAPYFPNFMYWESGGDSNLRYGANEDGYITLAVGSGQTASFQITASSMLPGATCFDLTSGDLVYEAYYDCGWTGTGAGGYHHGTSINGNTMRMIYHPGYTNGAFRIEGSFGTCSNQNIGYTVPQSVMDQYNMMKVTIHRNEDAGNYEFKIQMGLATNPETGEPGTYTYTYTHNCPIATIDAAGGIQSIGPYGYNNVNNLVTNLRLEAPFSDKATDLNNFVNEKRDYFITEDKPVHLYKLGDGSTTTVTDYGSNPQDGTASNVNRDVISNLNPVAEFIGGGSQITVAGAETINGPWTAEFLLNPSDMSSWQALMSGGSYSLRWSQYGALGKPGFTVSGVKDYVFTDLDGNPFSTEIPLNQWHHVAYVNDGEGSMLFYLDGELLGINTERTIPLAYNTIGTVGGGYFKGMMDYVGLYDYALSAEQIWNHANPVPEPATWAMLLFGAAGVLCLRKRRAAAVRS